MDKKTLMVPAVLILAGIWSYIMLAKGPSVFNWLDLVIFTLIIMLGITSLIQALRKKD